MANIKSRNVKPIVVSGHEFPMHSDYTFELQKVYAADNDRSLDFAIRVFAEKGFVPYFTVSYACVPLDTYEKMMELIAPDQMPVEYYDSASGEYKSAYFYAQQPEYDQILALQGDYKYVMGLRIVFAGTLSEQVQDMSAGIIFYANGGTGGISIAGLRGADVYLSDGNVSADDTVNTPIRRNGYSLSHWNTEPDGSGQSYALGAYMALRTNSLILYAQWKQNI